MTAEEAKLEATSGQDPRDLLWNEVFAIRYDALFEELVAEAVLRRWQRWDTGARVFIALSISLLAATSWLEWCRPGLRTVWTVVMGVSAALAILHATLGLPGRLRDWYKIRAGFSECIGVLEALRTEMRVDPQFPVDKMRDNVKAARSRYDEARRTKAERQDVLLSSRRLARIQQTLDNQLRDETL